MRYMVKYVGKREKPSKLALGVLSSVHGREDENTKGANGTTFKLHSDFIKTVREREISAYETNRLLLSGKISSSLLPASSSSRESKIGRTNLDPLSLWWCQILAVRKPPSVRSALS